jgi:ribonuclease BN (tRNA processing enzyme)
MAGRHHTSFVVEAQGRLYWFDAGEGCAYTAHVLGLDLLKTTAIFISHMHMDHVGGFPHLLWTMEKLHGRTHDPRKQMTGKTIDVYLPDWRRWDAILGMVDVSPDTQGLPFHIDAERYGDGVIHDDGILTVTARHNHHLGEPAGDDGWTSFSFLVQQDDQRLVYSGDVRDIRDFWPGLGPCDLLFMETGHHQVREVCTYLQRIEASEGVAFGRLVFVHHGRAILSDPVGQRQLARTILGDRVLIAHDGLSLRIGG